MKLLILLMVLCLPACGGGQLTAEEIAQHDADLQALKTMTTQPVNCQGNTQCR
jgi:hypothetical protein